MTTNQSVDQSESANVKQDVIIIGIYGLPGSGKSYTFDHLKQTLDKDSYRFYEGSVMISSIVPGGLTAFKEMEDEEQKSWRMEAIKRIKMKCAKGKQIGIVTGHYMFWSEEDGLGTPVCTYEDFKVYTHIIYLDVPAETLVQRRAQDSTRTRPVASMSHLKLWQRAEIDQLRRSCHFSGIIFTAFDMGTAGVKDIEALIQYFSNFSELDNGEAATLSLEDVLLKRHKETKTLLVFDADKTLSQDDTGLSYWSTLSKHKQISRTETYLRDVFGGRLGYSYRAFQQVALLYRETSTDEEFDRICDDVASEIIMHPDILVLLRAVKEQAHVSAMIITCGLQTVWKKVLQREELSDSVSVVGGERMSDGFVVTALVKAALVSHLQNKYDMCIWAFGDSVLDLPMLSQADRAFVVTGEEIKRSKTMDEALRVAIEEHNLSAHQILLPHHSSPRLDTARLPLISLSSPVFLKSVPGIELPCPRLITLQSANENTTKLLTTSMRDASVAGPLLREAHRRVGWHLATTYLPNILGIEESSIAHVQGHRTTGHRIYHEPQTLIVAMMRGGEPMAFGVSDALPTATFLHAKEPEDVRPEHLDGRIAVVLVDSVVNSGKSVFSFLKRVRALHATVRVVVVAGVVQREFADAFAIGRCKMDEGEHRDASEEKKKGEGTSEDDGDGDGDGTVKSKGNDNSNDKNKTKGKADGENGEETILDECYGFDCVALRISENKFTGKGGTDTGNRLFNTTNLM